MHLLAIRGKGIGCCTSELLCSTSWVVVDVCVTRLPPHRLAVGDDGSGSFKYAARPGACARRISPGQRQEPSLSLDGGLPTLPASGLVQKAHALGSCELFRIGDDANRL